MERVFEYIADADCNVESFLKSKGYSSRICNLLKKELGLVCVNDKPVFVVDKLKTGDKIKVILKENPSKIVPFDYKIDFVYQDNPTVRLSPPTTVQSSLTSTPSTKPATTSMWKL